MSQDHEDERCPKTPPNATWATHRFYRPTAIRWLDNRRPAYPKRCSQCGLEVLEDIPAEIGGEKGTNNG